MKSRYERRRDRQRSNAAKRGWDTRRENAAKARRAELAAARSARRELSKVQTERRLTKAGAARAVELKRQARSDAARKGWATRRAREAAERAAAFSFEPDYGDEDWYEIEIGLDYMGE